MEYTYAVAGAIAVTIFSYLWLTNHAMAKPLPEALQHAQKPWRKEEMQDAYDEARLSSVDLRPFLPPKKSRRYIVVGGSGMHLDNTLVSISVPTQSVRCLTPRRFPCSI